MARGSSGTIQLEWVNVTYRSVFAIVALVAFAVAAGLGGWYYYFVHGPKAEAGQAIAKAERRYDEAGGLSSPDPRLLEVVQSARVALREARESYGAFRYDDSRAAAIRSENLSMQAISMVKGGEETRLVHFYRLEGDVRVKKAGEFSWENAHGEMELHIGDQIKTSSSASAQLIYFDGTVTTIQPGSLLEIRELYENPVTKVRRVREQLNFGELEASTQKRNVEGSFHEVAAGKVSARSVDESEFRVTADEKMKESAVDVFNGQVEVASASKKESLVAGERIRAGADGRLSGKEVLPPVPVLIGPRDQKVFISEEPASRQITLNWQPIPGFERYHLVISDKALFTEPLHESDRDDSSAVLGEVPEGSYHWRVAAISPKGVRGPYSSPRRFRVSSEKIRDRADTVPPALEITEFVPVGMMVIVNGMTEPGATLWIDNEKVDVYDDGTFYAVVRLRKEGLSDMRFVAQDTAGNETELTRSAYVELY